MTTARAIEWHREEGFPSKNYFDGVPERAGSGRTENAAARRGFDPAAAVAREKTRKTRILPNLRKCRLRDRGPAN